MRAGEAEYSEGEEESGRQPSMSDLEHTVVLLHGGDLDLLHDF